MPPIRNYTNSELIDIIDTKTIESKICDSQQTHLKSFNTSNIKLKSNLSFAANLPNAKPQRLKRNKIISFENFMQLQKKN